MIRSQTIPSGEDLLPALAAVEAGSWVQGNGHVEGVELRLPGEATDVTRNLRGRFALVSLQGPAGGPFTASLARASDVGLELLGGVLVRARSMGVALAILPPAPQGSAQRDPSARREVINVTAATSPPSASASASSASSASASASSSTSSAAAPSPPVPASTWADVAAASDSAEEEEDYFPERGDLVDHFSFGLCEVVKADGDRIHMRDVKGPGRIREVVLSALKVMAPTRQNGKRCFRLQRKG